MRRTILMALLCSLICTSAFAGSVTGTVTYDGSVPKLRPYDMNADPDCAKKHSGGKATNQMLVLGDGNALANIFVQIKNPPAGNHSAPSEPVEIDQDGCIYVPRVSGVMAGQPVKFKNSDGILHNVHGLPEVNREFNIGMPPSLKESVQTFNKPEPLFKVKCDVHPWMNSYIAVMTHPYFAVTGTDGTFSIDGIADGSYEVEAWHERLGTQTGKVTISGGSGSVDFSFSPPKRN
ncbi:MAG: TonB-dependent receptor [Acidobacteriota bacterium]